MHATSPNPQLSIRRNDPQEIRILPGTSWRKTRLKPWHTQRRTDSQRWSLSLEKDLQLATDLAKGIGAGTMVIRDHTFKALVS